MASQLQHNETEDELAGFYRAAPGTEILFDEAKNHGAFAERLHSLKHVQKGDSRILLVPQPSTVDPNDPLSWSQVKKSLTFFNACWYAFMGSITGPIMVRMLMNLTNRS